MNEIEPIVHQDDHYSNNEHEVLLGDGDQVMHKASHGGEGTVIQANLEDLLRDKREAEQLAYLKAARMKMRMKIILETSIVVTTVTVAVEITCLEMMVTCRRFHV